jgi:hypothetical protein
MGNTVIKGVRKRCRVLWEVRPLLNHSGPILRFWRTGKYSITRETIIAAGLDVNRCGAETRQLTFSRIRKKT